MGHCGSKDEESNSLKNHQSSSQVDKSTIAESEENVVAQKKKAKNENKKKVSKGESIIKLNQSKRSKQAPTSLNQHQRQRQKSKAKHTSSMAKNENGRGASSSYAIATSSVGGPRTATAASSITGNKQLLTSTGKPYHLNSSRPNPLDNVREDQLLTVGLASRPLGRDQALKRAKVGGATINGDFVHNLITRQTLEKLRRCEGTSADVNTILQEEFSALSPIVPGAVYLTGTFGLQKEAFEAARVWVVVNATTELALLKLSQLLAVRVPVEDDTAHRIDRYFDDVADLIEMARRRGYGSVVHCAAGVSRSAALTLAYLLKYTDLSLLEAFRHTRTVRPVIRPNSGFMKQLAAYERKLRGDGHVSVRMVHLTDEKRGVTVYVPDFYPKEYPELYEWEVAKQQKIMMTSAMVNTTPNTGAATSAVSRTSNIGH